MVEGKGFVHGATNSPALLRNGSRTVTHNAARCTRLTPLGATTFGHGGGTGRPQPRPTWAQESHADMATKQKGPRARSDHGPKSREFRSVGQTRCSTPWPPLRGHTTDSKGPRIGSPHATQGSPSL